MKKLLPRALTAFCVLTTAAVAQRLPEIEPNDAPPNAQAVSVGTQVDALLTAGEQDWFVFTIGAPTSVRLFTSPLGTGPVDTVLTLTDPFGLLVLATNDDQRDVYSDITIELLAGSYLVQVTGALATTTGAYSLDLAGLPPVPPTGLEAPEPNQTPAGATPVGCGSRIGGKVATLADSDWYQVVLGVQSGVVFRVRGGGAQPLSSFHYRIWNAAGTQLLQPTGTLGGNSANNVPVGTDVIRCWPAGTYHFAVEASVVGDYELEVAVMPMNVGGPVNEAGAGPTAISSGQTGIGTLTLLDDDVWGPITVASEYLMAQTVGNGGSPLADSTIQLLDSAQQPFVDTFNQVVPSVTSGNLLAGPAHARGSWRISGAGSVYLRVTAPPANSGGYRLEIGQCSIGSFYDSAGKRVQPVNVLCLGSNGQRPTLDGRSRYEVPVLGSTFSRVLTLAPPSTPVFLMQGLQDQTSVLGPLPVSLAPFGAPGCTVDVDPLALSLAITDPFGEVVFDQQTPPVPALSGLRIYEQVFVLDAGANQLGATVSNSLVQLLGSMSW